MVHAEVFGALQSRNIRACARRVAGELLGTVGHLTQLRRTCSGSFTLAGSLAFEELSWSLGAGTGASCCAGDGMNLAWSGDREMHTSTPSKSGLSPEAALAHLPRG